MQLDGDDFKLFGLARGFALDRSELDARRRRLQAEVHPDRFASADAASRRRAMQGAVRVNEAYERLKDPLRRAAYLCELNGAPIRAEDNTAMPEDFLMQQMTWREALEEAHAPAEIEQVAAELEAYRAAAYRRLQATIDGAGDFASAAEQVRALMFVERFADDVDERRAREAH
jgi:molecular chaperone HscB